MLVEDGFLQYYKDCVQKVCLKILKTLPTLRLDVDLLQ